jgi:hypothetical protein
VAWEVSFRHGPVMALGHLGKNKNSLSWPWGVRAPGEYLKIASVVAPGSRSPWGYLGNKNSFWGELEGDQNRCDRGPRETESLGRVERRPK